VTESVETGLSDNQLLQIYRDMVVARRLDKWLMTLQRAGRVGIHAPAEGQEAAMVGSAHALEPGDWVLPSYREVPVYIARGVPISDILDRSLCNSADPLKGHDFAIYGDKRYHVVPASVPVGAIIPVAVGFAMAIMMRREKAVVMNYFGDGATSKGDFHEALNFAGVFKPPIVFFCQNNQYAISMHFSRQTAAKSIASKAEAYGIEGLRVDGNDVLACYLSARKAVEKARRGGGPTLIEAVTYRLGPHTTADDPSRYRPKEEEEEWRKRDPLSRFKLFLIARKLWDEEKDARLHEEVEDMLRVEVERAEQKPPLHPKVILEDVYASDPWYILDEKEELEESLTDAEMQQ